MTFFPRIAAAAVITFMPLAALAGEVLLTLTHDGGTSEFDIAALEALGAEEFSTTTIWTEGEQTFTGVSLLALLAEAGISDGTLKATAINDYAVEIPVSDAVVGGPIVAYFLNGEPMSVRDKGPLWIVYPFDADPHYQTEVIYSRSIWQLDRIELIE